MKFFKRAAGLMLALVVTASLLPGAEAQVLADGSYKKGMQWYFSEDTQFDYTGIVRYDENGNPVEPTDCYIFSEESPAAIYQEGVTNYTLTVQETDSGSELPIECKIGVRGDLNGDGVRNIFDSVFVAKFTTGTYEINDDFQAFCGDSDRNGRINIFDAVCTAKLALNDIKAERQKEQERINVLLKQVVELVNIERAKVGAAPVVMDAKLNEAAAVRAKEISVQWSHTRPNGESCFTVLDSMGIFYMEAGENLAMGYSTPEAVMEGWMNSKGHRENLLNPEHKKIGVGYYYSSKTDAGYYWSQFFTD